MPNNSRGPVPVNPFGVGFRIPPPFELERFVSQTDLDIELADESGELNLKKRHLSRSERERLHRPDPDWEMVGKKEVCHSACTLVVDDLLE